MVKGIFKIALEGTACVGKTTLLESLKKVYGQRSDVAYVDEVGRDFFKQNPKLLSKAFSPKVQSKLQDLILEREKQVLTLNPSVIICDRSVLDSSVHLKAMGNEKGSNDLLERVRFWLPTYSCFFVLDPKDIPYHQDEIRRESEETRNSIHKAFIDFLHQHNISYKILSDPWKKG